MSRKIKIDNENILNSFKKQDELKEKMKAMTDEAEVLQKEIKDRNERIKEIDEKGGQVISEMTREIEKIEPEAKRLMEAEKLEEFEEFSKFYIDENGDVIFEIADRLEEFKQSFKKQKYEQTKKNNSSSPLPNDGGSNDNAEQSA